MEAVPQTLSNLVADLSTALGETDPSAVSRLTNVATLMGEATCRELLVQALAIQANGGMERKDGAGFRSLGGIFFKLTKDRQVLGGALPMLVRPSADAVPSRNGELQVLLRHIASRASDAAAMIADNSNRVSDDAAQKIREIQSLLGNVTARLVPKQANASKRKQGRASPKPHRPSAVRSAGDRVASNCKKVAHSVGKSFSCGTGHGIAPPHLGYSRSAARGIAGFIYRPTGGKKPGSHSEGRHS